MTGFLLIFSAILLVCSSETEPDIEFSLDPATSATQDKIFNVTIHGECIQFKIQKWISKITRAVLFSDCHARPCGADAYVKDATLDCADVFEALKDQKTSSAAVRILNVFYGYFPDNKPSITPNLLRKMELKYDGKCFIGFRNESSLSTIGQDTCTIGKCPKYEYLLVKPPQSAIDCRILQRAFFGHGKDASMARSSVEERVKD